VASSDNIILRLESQLHTKVT